jgi:hypothetical protein
MSDERDRTSGDPLPAGYVERAVAELLTEAERAPGRVVRDVPFRSCPGCGSRLSDPRSFVQEFWVARETRFLVWCHRCGGTYTVVPIDRFIGTEATE